MFEILDWCMEHLVLPVLLVIVLMLVFVGLPMFFYSAYKDSKSPTFTLTKTEWACVASHPVTTTIYVQSGKVLVPVSSTHNVCDDYKRVP